MLFKFELKILIPAVVALTLGACSAYGDHRSNAYETYGTHQANGTYGVNSNGLSRYGVKSNGAQSHGIKSHGLSRYGVNHQGGGLNYGASNYGTSQVGYGQSPCASGGQGIGGLHSTNGSPPRIFRSRYGYVPEGFGCEQSGYWVYPQQQHVVEEQVVQQQVVEQQIVEQPAPKPIVIETCPEGQYRASNGDCAIMITEAPVLPAPIYEPPIYSPPPSFPVSPEQPIISYEPIRK